jgi:hypothetical protein
VSSNDADPDEKSEQLTEDSIGSARSEKAGGTHLRQSFPPAIGLSDHRPCCLQGCVFSAASDGDKVMQVENDYDKEVYNGDLGILSRIDVETSELTVQFDGRDVTYDFAELDELVLGARITSGRPIVCPPRAVTHKSTRDDFVDVGGSL